MNLDPRRRLIDELVEMARERGDSLDAVEARRARLADLGAVYYAAEETRFGNFLVEQGAVTPEELSIALARQAIARGQLGRADGQIANAERALERYRDRAAIHDLEMRTLTLQFVRLSGGIGRS
jgi:hypothetical protein